ncbi:MAG: metallopeptidase TldD-related protein [Alphaproteobacteria bacterium]
MPTTSLDPLALLDDLISRALKGGADGADGVVVESASLSVAQRLGASEGIERAESQDVGLRVFRGRRQAIVSSSDTSPVAVAELVERALAMAAAVPEDEFCGLADPALLASDIPDLDLCDENEPTPESMVALATAAEDAARAVHGVSNSEGAEAGWGRSRVALAASNGFAGSYAVSQHSVSASVIAGQGTDMERDYDYTVSRFAADLDDPAVIGRRAGERAVRRLGPRKASSGQVPLIYDWRVSGGLLGHLVGAITGPSVARGTSFLKDSLGEAIFAAGITITDDPRRLRGLRSKAFDGEGVATSARDIIADGVLTTWLLDSRSARQLGLATTGHASRGTSSPPSPSATNLTLAPGTQTPEEMIAEIVQGFLVTELMGMGVNGITGDYSRGAAGYWIENGEIAYPLSEVTVAGNLKDMFAAMTPANDLVLRAGIDAPTVRIDGMTVAGT